MKKDLLEQYIFLMEKKVCEHYYINDKRHNEKGPASISYDEEGNIKSKQYFINGEEVKKED